MLDSGLLSKNFIGRDGFIWWIGQVPDAKYWKGNIPTLPQDSPSDLPGFKYRVKVRILGYHTADLNKLPDDDLPWALVMLPTTAGSGSGANAITPRFAGGEFVFGFFLDGDNGQQPVVIGMLGNSTQTLLSKSLPSVGFKPFSGHTSSEKAIPPHGMKTSESVESDRVVNNNETIPTGSKGGAPNVVVAGTSPDPSKSPNQEASNSTGDLNTAHQERQQQDNNTYPLANACKKGSKNKDGIKNALQRLTKTLSGIQKYFDSYISPVLNLAQNISAEISLCAGIIAGYLKDYLNKFRHFIFTEINKRIQKLLSKLSTKKQIVAGEVQQKVIDAIGCVFNRIIDALKGLVESFLNKMLDRLFDIAECVIDNMIGSLLDSILGPLNSAITSALGPLNALLSGAMGALSQAISYASMLEKFLSCEEEDQCPETETWSWLDGPKPGTEDNFSKTLSKVGTTASSSLSNFLGNPPVSSVSAGSIGQCFSGLTNCGAPKIEIFGGGGAGASANAIIGNDGEILAVDLLDSGIDYYSNPFVYFDDACGNGSGAKAESIVGTDGNDCGKLIGIKVVDGGRGYLKRSNGSLGHNGKTAIGINSDAKALVIPSGADFSIDFNTFEFNKNLAGLITATSGVSTSIIPSKNKVPCGIITQYPSLGVFVRQSAFVSIPPNGSIILSPAMSPLTNIPGDTQKNGTTYTFPTGANITVPSVAISTSSTSISSLVAAASTAPASPTNDYKVVLELDEIIVKNSGVNYSPNDKICITPDNGANLVPQFDPYGRLISVKILNKGTYVTARPVITICESETGINAEMFAVLKSRKVSDDEIRRLDDADKEKLITVVDCVGKVNV